MREMIYVRLFRNALVCLLFSGRFIQLNNTLIEHGIGDLDEPGYVCADHEIAGLRVLFRSVPGVLKDGGHDVAQTGIDLFARPWQAH